MPALLIAPWGCPAQWRVAKYFINGKNIESCTSLLPILKFLNEDVSVVIIVLDSLVDKYTGREIKSPCYDYYVKYYDEFFHDRITSYDDLVNRCKGFVKSIVNDIAKEAGIRIKDLRIVVGPCVGSPGGEWRFKGDANDFAAIVLYELGKLCLERKYVEVILDLSHGINFMPSVCLRIAYLLAGLLMVTYGDQDYVTLKVYNSDPFPPGAKHPALNVNLTMKETVRTAYIPHRVLRYLIKSRCMVPKDLQERMRNINNRYFDAVCTILSSLYYPLPLALCRALNEYDMNTLKRIVDEAVTIWKENIKIDYSQKQVTRLLRLLPEAVYNFLLVYASYLRVRRDLKNLENIRVIDLKKLSKLYEVVNESYYYLIMQEVSEIEDSIKYHKWTKSSVLYVELKGGTKRKPFPNKRIMIAHAGLQMDFTRIYQDGRIEYAFDILGVEKVKDLLKKAGLLLKEQHIRE